MYQDKRYLEETEAIDYNNPIIQEKVKELKQISQSQLLTRFMQNFLWRKKGWHILLGVNWAKLIIGITIQI